MDDAAIVAVLVIFLKIAGIVLIAMLVFVAYSYFRSAKRQKAYRKTRGWRNRLSNDPRPRHGAFWQKMKRANAKKKDKPQSFYSDRR